MELCSPLLTGHRSLTFVLIIFRSSDGALVFKDTATLGCKLAYGLEGAAAYKVLCLWDDLVQLRLETYIWDSCVNNT